MKISFVAGLCSSAVGNLDRFSSVAARMNLMEAKS